MSLLLLLDGDLAGHLALAVSRHRQVLDQLGRACPLELEQIEQTLTELATGSQEQSGAVAAPRCGNVPAVDREWLSVSECAGITGLSESTVRRALRDGLPSARVGRARRIHRDSLAEFMGGRA